MTEEKLKELYLNWKGLELIHSLKSVSRVLLIILSIIFIIISINLNNTYILMASLIVLFLQILSENNKEYYLKYKEIFEKIKNGNKNSHNDWINFLEKTKGLNSIYRMILDLFYKRKFEKIIKNAKPKNKAKAN